MNSIPYLMLASLRLSWGLVHAEHGKSDRELRYIQSNVAVVLSDTMLSEPQEWTLDSATTGYNRLVGIVHWNFDINRTGYSRLVVTPHWHLDITRTGYSMSIDIVHWDLDLTRTVYNRLEAIVHWYFDLTRIIYIRLVGIVHWYLDLTRTGYSRLVGIMCWDQCCSIRQYSVDYKLETYLKIARLYLEDDDPVQGEAYINRASILQVGVPVSLFYPFFSLVSGSDHHYSSFFICCHWSAWLCCISST